MLSTGYFIQHRRIYRKRPKVFLLSSYLGPHPLSRQMGDRQWLPPLSLSLSLSTLCICLADTCTRSPRLASRGGQQILRQQKRTVIFLFIFPFHQPSDSAVSEDAGIESPVACTYWIDHNNKRLDLIHGARSRSRLFHPPLQCLSTAHPRFSNLTYPFATLK